MGFLFMNDTQLLRYSRHILLPELGIEAQTRWLASHALIIGAGGLGCAAALYLGSAGMGHLTLIDHDTIDLTNLQRQIAHTHARVGELKVHSLRTAIQSINPDIQITPVAQKLLSGPTLDDYVHQADVVLDCSDNFATRQAINSACVKLGKPLVSGAAVAWDGQLFVYMRAPESEGPPHQSPCYACLFPPESKVLETPCSTMGVMAPLVGMIGSMQAIETLKLLSGLGSNTVGRLFMINALRMKWTSIHVQPDPNCPICRGSFSLPPSRHEWR